MAQNLVIDGTVFNGVDSIAMTNEAGEKVTYIEKTNPGTGVSVAQIGERQFYTVEDALAAAVSGDTVAMIADSAEQASLLVPGGITLDLDGHTLEAAFFATAPGSEVLNSKVDGILRVPQNAIALSKSNTYIPIWNGVDGYYLNEWSYGTVLKTDGEARKYYFIPKPRNAGTFNPAVIALLQDGTTDNQLRIESRMTFDKDSGETATQILPYRQETISNVYTKNPDCNGNGTTFINTVTGFANLTNPKVYAAVVSDLGPEDASTPKDLT